MRIIQRIPKKKPDYEYVRCPRCGALVQRPGDASMHGCFQFAQGELDKKLKELEFIWNDPRTRRPKVTIQKYRNATDMRKW